jgi:hypothetical protein
MDPGSPSAVSPDDDAARRVRARERLYVIFQTVGWGFLLTTQLAFMRVVWSHKPAGTDERLGGVAAIVMVTALGWLISHYSRALIARWGWKRSDWRALLPRVLLFSAAQSLAWSTIGYGYLNGILRVPVPSEFGLWTSVGVSVFNGVLLFVGWWSIYFLYHLFDRFNRLEIERLRVGAILKEAELRALKAQVNPHFIFNSLNSLRALIDENPARAREAVTQLANLLRYSLQSGQHETVPLEDELRIVGDYLALEQVRHEERLRVRLDIGPDTRQCPIPPMLLQTLVENAVKYGISARAEGGEILVVARREPGLLRLRVTNPGELATADSRRRQSSTGVGLRNATERLRLLFGERATLRLCAEAPALVVAEAVMPPPAERA